VGCWAASGRATNSAAMTARFRMEFLIYRV
jgi:hypothetical protein